MFQSLVFLFVFSLSDYLHASEVRILTTNPSDSTAQNQIAATIPEDKIMHIISTIAETDIRMGYYGCVHSYGTLILPFEAKTPDGVSAYTDLELSEDGQIMGNSVSTISANIPVLLKAENDIPPLFYYVSGYAVAPISSTMSSGILTGTYERKDNLSGTDYVLQRIDDIFAFYHVNPEKSPVIYPFRAYLTPKDEPSDTKQYLLNLEKKENTTNVRNVNLTTDRIIVGTYQISGQKTSKTVKGFNIIRFSDGSVSKTYNK